QGMVQEVVLKESKEQPDMANYSFQFSNGFPANKPEMLEHAFNGQLTGMIGEYASSYAGLGQYLQKEGNATHSLQYFQKAYAWDIQNAITLNGLALYYGKSHQYERSLTYFKKEQIILPNDPRAAYNIGFTYLQLGNKDEAKNWFTKSLQLAKNNAEVANEDTTALDSINNTSKTSESENKNKSKNNSDTQWQIYADKSLHLTFTYPPKYVTRPISSNLVGIFMSGDNTPIIT